VCHLPRDALRFGYRFFDLPRGFVVTHLGLLLQPGDPQAIAAQRDSAKRRRASRQPVGYPNAGSVFKNPPGSFAGRLIEAAGLKGLRHGGAMVSDQHANFIVNVGGATAADVCALMREVTQRVLETGSVRLEPESNWSASGERREAATAATNAPATLARAPRHAAWPAGVVARDARPRDGRAVCAVALMLACGRLVPPAVDWVKTHPYFALTTIEIDGNRRLSRGEILDWVGVSTLTACGRAAATGAGAPAGHPWVREVCVRRFSQPPGARRDRAPPGGDRAARRPAVRRPTGHLLGPLRGDDSRDFPVITGFDGPAQADFVAVGMHRALQLLRRCERLSCFDAVSEVHVDRETGLTVFPLRTAVAVVLGWGSCREKLARSARVFAAWEGQVERLLAVDVSFRDLVVVKLRVEERHPAAVRAPKRGMRV
jgi:hypothetical protein